jgi:hypothetical protein
MLLHRRNSLLMHVVSVLEQSTVSHPCIFDSVARHMSSLNCILAGSQEIFGCLLGCSAVESCWNYWRCRGAYCFHPGEVNALMMVRTSETSVYLKEPTRRYIPEDCLHTRHRQKVKSHIIYIYLRVNLLLEHAVKLIQSPHVWFEGCIWTPVTNKNVNVNPFYLVWCGVS